MRLRENTLALTIVGILCLSSISAIVVHQRGKPTSVSIKRKGALNALSLSSTTFLTNNDFDRAQNMTFMASESVPVPVALAANSDVHYYEGDMMIQESDENKVAMYTAKRWPDGKIPYVMEDKFTEDERAAIARGIMLLQERTCIRFEPRDDSDEDYVLIRRGPGCAAHVGRIGGQQWIILGDGCFGIETVTHELMHSVGFIHEQSRPDRDDHVEIVWDNIKSSAKRNFRKHEFDYLADHGFPYDLMSVMHYRQYAFSKNRKPTIVPKTPVPYLRCRGMDCPSELDIKKINFLYKCHPKNEDDYEDNYNRENDIDGDPDVEDMLVGAKNTLGIRPDSQESNEDDEHGNSSEMDDFRSEPFFRHAKRRKPKFWFEQKPRSAFEFPGYDDDDHPERSFARRSDELRDKRQFFHVNELPTVGTLMNNRNGQRRLRPQMFHVNYPPSYLL